MSSNEVRIRCGASNNPAAPIVYGDATKFSALFSGSEVVAAGGAVDKQVTRAGSTVRRYPGDPAPFNRAGSDAEYSILPIRGQQTTPGRPFTVEFPLSVSPGQRRTVRQFTLLTPWSDFAAYASASCTNSFIIRSPGGRPTAVFAD
jgi:hypothetical protein